MPCGSECSLVHRPWSLSGISGIQKSLIQMIKKCVVRVGPFTVWILKARCAGPVCRGCGSQNNFLRLRMSVTCPIFNPKCKQIKDPCGSVRLRILCEAPGYSLCSSVIYHCCRCCTCFYCAGRADLIHSWCGSNV